MNFIIICSLNPRIGDQPSKTSRKINWHNWLKPSKTETATKIVFSIILAQMEFYCRESFNWIRWASQIKILDITVVSAQAFSPSESKLSHNYKITLLRFSHKLYLNRHRFRVFITNSPRNSKKMKFSTMFVACNISGTLVGLGVYSVKW